MIPNFLFIGPDKSGSTWVHNALSWHPEVYMSQVKEIFYFDRYYHFGEAWYANHFRRARPHHRIIGEVSHDYLFSKVAATRIASDLPNVRLMACLREPVDRAFSAYLYLHKQGRLRCDFSEAISSFGELIEHGRYARDLRVYLSLFPSAAIHVALFDDLQQDPVNFARNMFKFLNVEALDLPNNLIRPLNPSAKPRFFRVAQIARRAGWAVREAGRPEVVRVVKNSRMIQKSLYRAYGAERPVLGAAARDALRPVFRNEVEQLAELIGVDVVTRWGY
jgi:hypothetical protein